MSLNIRFALLGIPPKPRRGTRERQTRTFWRSLTSAPVITVLLDAEANLAARTLLGGILQENEALKDYAIYWRLYLIN